MYKADNEEQLFSVYRNPNSDSLQKTVERDYPYWRFSQIVTCRKPIALSESMTRLIFNKEL